VTAVILRRLGALLTTLVILSFVVFLLVKILPGNPALTTLGNGITKSEIAARDRALGLDHPVVQQYWNWLTGALHGNFGKSYITGEPVAHSIVGAVPVTFTLVIGAMVVAVVLGVTAGVLAAWRRDREADRVVSGFSALGIGVPTFWLALVLVSIFAVDLHWLPAIGYVSVVRNPVQGLRHLVLPALALGVVGAAAIARQVRSAMISALGSDFTRTLYAKGLSRRSIMLHALKNSALPTLTMVGLQVPAFLGAAVLVESIFALPGLGNLILQATLQKDSPVIEGVTLVVGVAVVMTGFLVDLSYRLVDPRVRAVR
jgi:peptide/nickel transport system permease protein